MAPWAGEERVVGDGYADGGAETGTAEGGAEFGCVVRVGVAGEGWGRHRGVARWGRRDGWRVVLGSV